jgi:hypothetical protein
MQFLSLFLRPRTSLAKRCQYCRASNQLVQMATATATDCNVFIPKDTVPTAGTKIKLADKILISPLGKQSTLFDTVTFDCMIVLGTWAWGDKKQWGWSDELDGKAKEAFDMSIVKGINTFDTAEIYGGGER